MYKSQTPWSLSPTFDKESSATARSAAPKRPWALLKALLRAAIILCSVSLGAFLAVSLYKHPMFTISEVNVQGTHRLAPAELVEHGGLAGQNLLALSVESTEGALLKDPWVQAVTIQRYLPNRVSIIIQEREPVAIWQTGNRRFLVGKDGAVLEETFVPSDLPVIQAMEGNAPSPGDTLDSSTIALTLTLLDLLPKELGDPAKRFEYLSYGGLVVETQSGKRARFGDSSDFEWKLAVWKALLKQGQEQKLQVNHVDLRFGDRPFFRQ